MEKNLGYYFSPNDAGALAELIVELSENPAVRTQITQSVRAFFDEECDADRIYSSFVEHIENIAETSRQ